MNLIHKIVSIALLTGVAVSVQAQTSASEQRLDAVAERGRQVMPFHLDKTQHVFSKTEHGGIQQVLVKDAADQQQIELIRRHLADISRRFEQGDFSRQRHIHGDDMPGLVELAESKGAVRYQYRELSNGAEIEFSAEQPALVDAIHRYFNAQLRDHARHAVDGRPANCPHHQQHHRHHHAGKE